MTKSGRIACVNPACKRTADAAKYAGSTEIICGKCWKRVPGELRHAYRRRWATYRKLRRQAFRKGDENRHFPVVERLIDETWQKIRVFAQNMQNPPQTQDLAQFLKEMGLD